MEGSGPLNTWDAAVGCYSVWSWENSVYNYSAPCHICVTSNSINLCPHLFARACRSLPKQSSWDVRVYLRFIHGRRLQKLAWTQQKAPGMGHSARLNQVVGGTQPQMGSLVCFSEHLPKPVSGFVFCDFCHGSGWITLSVAVRPHCQVLYREPIGGPEAGSSWVREPTRARKRNPRHRSSKFCKHINGGALCVKINQFAKRVEVHFVSK